MDFQLSPQMELLRKSVREFAEGAIAPKVAHMEETDEVPWDLYKEISKQMYMGILIPKEYGGMAFGNLARMIMLEEVGRVSAAMAMALQIFHMGTASIADFGNEAQKKKYLPAMAKGERLGTIAVTEATGGSDPTGIQTAAKLQGDSYVLNGRKCFITHGHVADTITVMAKTGDGPKGFSAFIVEKSFPGFKLGRKERKFGLHGCNTGEIVLENCMVPRENLLGNEGDGLKVSMTTISEVGRAGMAGCGLGVISACLEASVKFANQRALGGKPISQHQGIQWQIADMYMDLEMSRLARLPGFLDAGSEDTLRHGHGNGQVLCHGGRRPLRQEGRGRPRRLRVHDGVPGPAVLPGCGDPDRLRRHVRDPKNRHGPQGAFFI